MRTPPAWREGGAQHVEEGGEAAGAHRRGEKAVRPQSWPSRVEEVGRRADR